MGTTGFAPPSRRGSSGRRRRWPLWTALVRSWWASCSCGRARRAAPRMAPSATAAPRSVRFEASRMAAHERHRQPAQQARPALLPALLSPLQALRSMRPQTLSTICHATPAWPGECSTPRAGQSRRPDCTCISRSWLAPAMKKLRESAWRRRPTRSGSAMRTGDRRALPERPRRDRRLGGGLRRGAHVLEGPCGPRGDGVRSRPALRTRVAAARAGGRIGAAGVHTVGCALRSCGLHGHRLLAHRKRRSRRGSDGAPVWSRGARRVRRGFPRPRHGGFVQFECGGLRAGWYRFRAGAVSGAQVSSEPVRVDAESRPDVALVVPARAMFA